MKPIESINYNSVAQIITVNWRDATATTYTAADAAQYVADTGRTADFSVLANAGQTTLSERKAEKWSEIKAHRDRLTEAGGFKVGTDWFHSDTKSRSQHLGLVMLGANIPAGTQWKTMGGTFVSMTPALAGQILTAAAASDIAIFQAAEAHRTAMEASANPSAYDYSAGWPATFLG